MTNLTYLETAAVIAVTLILIIAAGMTMTAMALRMVGMDREAREILQRRQTQTTETET